MEVRILFNMFIDSIGNLVFFSGVNDLAISMIDAVNLFLGFAFYTAFSMFLRFLDIIQYLFRILAGIGAYSFRGDSTVYQGDLVLGFVTHNSIVNIFWAMLFVGFVLVIVSTFIAVIKTEFEPLRGADPKKLSKGRVISNAMRTIFSMVAVPVIVLFGLVLSSSLLATLDLASAPGRTQLLSHRIFVVSADAGSRHRNDSEFRDLLNPPDNADGNGNFGIFTEEAALGGYYDVADMIDYAFANALEVPWDAGTGSEYELDALAEEYGSVGGLFAVYGNIINEKDLEGDVFSIYNFALVHIYYDMSLVGGMSYLLMGVLIAIFGLNLLFVMVGLVKRLLMLTTLFAVAPPIFAVYPLTEKPYQEWKKAFIGNTLSAYSIIVVMNIFTAMIPIIMDLQFFLPTNSEGLTDGTPGFALDALNRLASILVLIAASFFFKDASKKLAGIIGAEDAMSDGQAMAGKIGKMAVGASLMGLGGGGRALGAMGGMGRAAGGMGKAVLHPRRSASAVRNATSNAYKKTKDGVAGATGAVANKAFNYDTRKKARANVNANTVLDDANNKNKTSKQIKNDMKIKTKDEYKRLNAIKKEEGKVKKEQGLEVQKASKEQRKKQNEGKEGLLSKGMKGVLKEAGLPGLAGGGKKKTGGGGAGGSGGGAGGSDGGAGGSDGGSSSGDKYTDQAIDETKFNDDFKKGVDVSIKEAEQKIKDKQKEYESSKASMGTGNKQQKKNATENYRAKRQELEKERQNLKELQKKEREAKAKMSKMNAHNSGDLEEKLKVLEKDSAEYKEIEAIKNLVKDLEGKGSK